jgi:hypothetical protein
MDDWKRNTDYALGYGLNHPVIKSFWKTVESWDADKQAKLIHFVTGTTRIPATGFKDLMGIDGRMPFTIKRFGEPNLLPVSHTW